MKPTYALAVVAVVITTVIAAGPAVATAGIAGQMQQQTDSPDEATGSNVTISNVTVSNFTTSFAMDSMEMSAESTQANTTVNVTATDVRMDLQNASLSLTEATVTNDSVTIEDGQIRIENATVSVGSAMVESNGMTANLEDETVSIENRTVMIENRTFSFQNHTAENATEFADNVTEDTADEQTEMLQRTVEGVVVHSITMDGVSASLSVTDVNVQSVDWGDRSGNMFASDLESRLDGASVAIENVSVENRHVLVENGSAQVTEGEASLELAYIDDTREQRLLMDWMTQLNDYAVQFSDVMFPLENLTEEDNVTADGN